MVCSGSQWRRESMLPEASRVFHCEQNLKPGSSPQCWDCVAWKTIQNKTPPKIEGNLQVFEEFTCCEEAWGCCWSENISSLVLYYVVDIVVSSTICWPFALIRTSGTVRTWDMNNNIHAIQYEHKHIQFKKKDAK